MMDPEKIEPLLKISDQITKILPESENINPPEKKLVRLRINVKQDWFINSSAIDFAYTW